MILKTLGRWAKRDLTIVGKIHIIKTFGISQIVFLMQSLSLPETVLMDIYRIFFRFLWRKRFTNKRAFEKIKRDVMTNDLTEGGLKMIDLIKMQESFLLNWAEKLLSPNPSQWKGIASGFFKKLGGINVFRSKISQKNFTNSELIPSIFWKNVLSVWLRHCDNDKINTYSEKDPIFNNTLITYRSQVLFLPTCINRGLLTLKDAISDGVIISYEEFTRRYGNYARSQLDYNIISNSISKVVQMNDIKTNDDIVFKNRPIGTLGRKFFYESINQCHNPLCTRIWERKYNISITKQNWLIVNQVKESRLKALNWKVLHNIYPNNIILQKMGISESRSCTFCNEIDYPEHFLLMFQSKNPLSRDPKIYQSSFGSKCSYPRRACTLRNYKS